MQLGARWRCGTSPHRSVPMVLHAVIAEQEALHSGADSWTLTWLEGRPRATLDDLVMVSVNESGAVLVSSGGFGQNAGDGFEGTGDDDEDQWLS